MTQNLKLEKQSHVIPFILDRSKVILELYLGDVEQAKVKQTQLCEAIKAKLTESMNDQSLRNMLLDYLIQFTDASDEKGWDFLQKMAETGAFPG